MKMKDLLQEYGLQYKHLDDELLPTGLVMATTTLFIGFFEDQQMPGDPRGREREVVWLWAIIGRYEEVLAEWDTEPSLTDLLKVEASIAI